ncbi:hypothetical protein LWF15_02845 [Kineosporia rhizophila]|uniref:hypothetical protein n=1 Tax=Kineosporia TaxID=49184 RepID=UPI001E3EF5B2|nr:MULTISPECIES: hypothetical protein [Kineosporia]MCE0534436.1 hypothetical protein [Kineosporia rhizophila]GLY13970.1 hypothetical protein Kisp01_09860 [Kineosporia sp. NBRC 101677]
MSVVIAAIAVFPVLTLLIIGLAKAENGLMPRSTPAELPGPATSVPAPDSTVS